MAIVPWTKTDAGNAVVYKWAGMAKGDVGQPMGEPAFGDRCAQVFGSFDSATCTIQGTNEEANNAANWTGLTDPQGNALAFAAAGLEQVMETPRNVRPSVSGSGGSASITVIIYARRTLK